MTSTFHGTSISNCDLKVIHYMDLAMGLLRNLVMNKIMDVAIVNEDNEFLMLDITN
jgi:hypothetical protein